MFKNFIMKSTIKFAAFFMIVSIVFAYCKKNIEQAPVNPPVINLPPIARAGPDQSFTVSFCPEKAIADLDGSGSTDPEGTPLIYIWRKVSGPEGSLFTRISGGKTTVVNIPPAEYAYELLVRDAGNLTSRDTMLISVKPALKEYDLDITFNSTFNFIDNDEDCGPYGYGPCTGGYDRTIIEGTGIFLPIGQFDLYISENADSAASSYATSSSGQMYHLNVNNASLFGTCSVNWKKLIQQGGGSFNGTFTVTDGSAKKCVADIYKNLPPLAVTGSLDLITRKVTLTIKGKVYF